MTRNECVLILIVMFIFLSLPLKPYYRANFALPCFTTCDRDIAYLAFAFRCIIVISHLHINVLEHLGNCGINILILVLSRQTRWHLLCYISWNAFTINSIQYITPHTLWIQYFAFTSVLCNLNMFIAFYLCMSNCWRVECRYSNVIVAIVDFSLNVMVYSITFTAISIKSK